MDCDVIEVKVPGIVSIVIALESHHNCIEVPSKLHWDCAIFVASAVSEVSGSGVPAVLEPPTGKN